MKSVSDRYCRKRGMNVSELLKRLEMERMQGNFALSNYPNDEYWVNWDDIVEIVEDHDQPQLNENQQIVLEWLKREHFDSYIKSVLSNLYFYVNMTAIGDLENKEIQEMVNTYEKLSQEEFAQVLQVFSTWALEQEEE